MRLRNTLFLIAALSVLIITIGFALSLISQNPSSQTRGTGEVYEVHITSSGFYPRILNIKIGDTLVFINDDTGKHWVASDIHPTHNVYPEKRGCIGSKFDSCRGLARGESFEFTFNYKGSWSYHDHLNPSLTGFADVQ